MSNPLISSGEYIAGRVLFHYGVKGMQWGVRKDTSPTAVTTTQKPGKRVAAKGGARQPAAEDAVRAAVARRKAKASTTDALSNKELQELVNRMNLEQQYARLTESNQSAGAKLAKAFVGDFGKKKLFEYADEAVTGNDHGVKARPHLKPVVDSLKVAAGSGGGKKKNK